MQEDWVPMQKDWVPMQKQILWYIEAVHCLKRGYRYVTLRQESNFHVHEERLTCGFLHVKTTSKT